MDRSQFQENAGGPNSTHGGHGSAIGTPVPVSGIRTTTSSAEQTSMKPQSMGAAYAPKAYVPEDSAITPQQLKQVQMYAEQIRDPKAPPMAAKHQKQLIDHLWWRQSSVRNGHDIVGNDAEIEQRLPKKFTTEDFTHRVPAPGQDSMPSHMHAPSSSDSATNERWKHMKEYFKDMSITRKAAEITPDVHPASDLKPTNLGDGWDAAVGVPESMSANPATTMSPSMNPNTMASNTTSSAGGPKEISGGPISRFKDFVLGRRYSGSGKQPTAPTQTEHSGADTHMHKLTSAEKHVAPVMDIGSPLPPAHSTKNAATNSSRRGSFTSSPLLAGSSGSSAASPAAGPLPSADQKFSPLLLDKDPLGFSKDSVAHLSGPHSPTGAKYDRDAASTKSIDATSPPEKSMSTRFMNGMKGFLRRASFSAPTPASDLHRDIDASDK